MVSHQVSTTPQRCIPMEQRSAKKRRAPQSRRTNNASSSSSINDKFSYGGHEDDDALNECMPAKRHRRNPVPKSVPTNVQTVIDTGQQQQKSIEVLSSPEFSPAAFQTPPRRTGLLPTPPVNPSSSSVSRISALVPSKSAETRNKGAKGPTIINSKVTSTEVDKNNNNNTTTSSSKSPNITIIQNSPPRSSCDPSCHDDDDLISADEENSNINSPVGGVQGIVLPSFPPLKDHFTPSRIWIVEQPSSSPHQHHHQRKSVSSIAATSCPVSHEGQSSSRIIIGPGSSGGGVPVPTIVLSSVSPLHHIQIQSPRTPCNAPIAKSHHHNTATTSLGNDIEGVRLPDTPRAPLRPRTFASLSYGIARGNKKSVIDALVAGADPNTAISIKDESSGCTEHILPILGAVKRPSSASVVKALIEGGAVVNAVTRDGQTALHVLAQNECVSSSSPLSGCHHNTTAATADEPRDCVLKKHHRKSSSIAASHPPRPWIDLKKYLDELAGGCDEVIQKENNDHHHESGGGGNSLLSSPRDGNISSSTTPSSSSTDSGGDDRTPKPVFSLMPFPSLISHNRWFNNPHHHRHHRPSQSSSFMVESDVVLTAKVLIAAGVDVDRVDLNEKRAIDYAREAGLLDLERLLLPTSIIITNRC